MNWKYSNSFKTFQTKERMVTIVKFILLSSLNMMDFWKSFLMWYTLPWEQLFDKLIYISDWCFRKTKLTKNLIKVLNALSCNATALAATVKKFIFITFHYACFAYIGNKNNKTLFGYIKLTLSCNYLGQEIESHRFASRDFLICMWLIFIIHYFPL